MTWRWGMSENDEKFDRAQKALEGLSDQFYEGDLEGLFDSGGGEVRRSTMR